MLIIWSRSGIFCSLKIFTVLDVITDCVFNFNDTKDSMFLSLRDGKTDTK
ncbi:MAG: hypothetical protein ACXVP0_00515 [Bacteroidia bacterium]